MNLFCSKKKWLLPECDIEKARVLCEEMKISEVLAQLLIKRGADNPSDARWFLKSDELYLYDPFLLADMEKAVERIKYAIDNKEKICVYGDYDVDGITATAVMYNYFRSKSCDCIYYIPQRLTEGYGMNKAAVDKLHSEGVDLIVTVDNGITADPEIAYAKTFGIDVVVTDHHECRTELPQCCAVVNPKRPDNKYPFDGLAGVGVAFKVVCALEGENADDDFVDKYADLAALGTVADVMPLQDENRQLVARGLSCIGNGSNRGITALIDMALIEKNKGKEKKITTSTVGFLIAPRLNAAGRIGDVTKAVELLTQNDFSECLDISKYLCEMNKERQQIENRIYSEAIELIEKDHDFDNDSIIVACADDWHHGVVGIVASRITEKYGLPSILICRENGVGKGSARSIKGFNINEAIHSCNDLLVRHGGHELAAGLTIELDKTDEFRKRINDYSREKITKELTEGSIEIDAELCGADISLAVCDEIDKLQPFGISNPIPLLYLRDAKVLSVIPLGKNKHTKLILEKDGTEVEALYFGFPGESFTVPASGYIDVLCNMDINEFRGERTPQLIIRDIRLCKQDAEKCAYYTDIMHSILEGKNARFAPDTELCRTVYKYLRGAGEKLDSQVNLFILSTEIKAETGLNIPCPVLGVILEVFSEMGLVRLSRTDDLIMKIELVKNCGKIDIESSRVLMRARAVCR